MLSIADIWDKKSSVYYKHKSITKKIAVAQGGGQAGKTIAILQVIIDYALENPKSITTVFGMTYDHLERGALRQFKELVDYNDKVKYFFENPESVRGPFKLKNKSIIEFIALDKPSKALGAKRDVSFLNEANEISYQTYRNISLRTTKRIHIDYNPIAEFWVHTKVLPFKNEAYGYIANFTHNEFAPPEAVEELKGYLIKWKETGSPYWRNQWLTMGLGETGIPEGVVFPHVTVIEKFPEKKDLKNFGYAVDWGFSQDPTTLIRCGVNLKGEFIGQEIIYETGLNAYSLDELFPKYGVLKTDPIIADSANPDAIDWLQKKGWNIFPADKPPGSLKSGIELLNKSGINIVQGSENFLQERAKYVYKTRLGVIDKDEPIDAWNHCFDPSRYFMRWAVHNKGVNPKKAPRGKRTFGNVNLFGS
ncbi:MAG: hypothetical protein IPO78_17585 [Saprospiraceae bacterium]|nr:hypothetical protein [Saprospiraceae bacterium]